MEGAVAPPAVERSPRLSFHADRPHRHEERVPAAGAVEYYSEEVMVIVVCVAVVLGLDFYQACSK